MDPLVRAALGVQRGLAAALGSLLALGGGVFLTIWFEAGRLTPLAVGVLGALSLSFAYRMVERYVRLARVAAQRLEIELGLHAAVLVYGAVLSAPHELSSAVHPIVYALAMWAAGFLCFPAAVATLFAAVTLETSIWVRGGQEFSVWLAHCALVLAFGALNLVVFRTEIARVRRLSRERIAAEIKRLKDEARSYRLHGAQQSAVRAVAAGAQAPSGDQERLTNSSVEHLQLSLGFALPTLRAAVGARTVAVLWLDAESREIELRDASTSFEELGRGPFSAREGVFAAALASRGPVTFDASPHGRFPLYPAKTASGALAMVPLAQDGNTTGFLALEGAPGWQVTPATLSMASEASEFIGRAVESERIFVSLERAKTEQGKLYAAADMLAAARSEVEVIQAGVDAARQFTHFDFAAVTLFHRSTTTHEICAVSGEGADALVGRVFRHNGGLVSMAVANQHPLPYRGTYQPKRQMVFDRQLSLPAMPSLIVLPLSVHDSALGTLILGSNEIGAFGEELRPTLEILARHVAVSLANARMVKRLEELATTDGLTGLLNKRTLTDVARQKIRSAERFGKPLSMIIGDIDHFKRVNDNYGHDIGDQVIKGFAEVLRRSKRETDAVGRFGGEEFVLVCEHTDEAGAVLLASRIRQELEATTFHTPNGPLQVTCSLGIATFPQGGTEWETLFKATDEALYASKHAGRNRVSSWQPSMRGAA
jgi:two-component system, cell cycle response regulator